MHSSKGFRPPAMHVLKPAGGDAKQIPPFASSPIFVQGPVHAPLGKPPAPPPAPAAPLQLPLGMDAAQAPSPESTFGARSLFGSATWEMRSVSHWSPAERAPVRTHAPRI